jgi:hypothetical protein
LPFLLLPETAAEEMKFFTFVIQDFLSARGVIVLPC